MPETLQSKSPSPETAPPEEKSDSIKCPEVNTQDPSTTTTTTTTTTESDSAVPKKKSKNKAQRKKAQAAAAGGESANSNTTTASDPQLLTDLAQKFIRQTSSCFKDGGLGLVATKGISKNEILFSKRPAVSVIFDGNANEVCSYCYRVVNASSGKNNSTVTITQTINRQVLPTGEKGGFGIRLDQKIPKVLTRCQHQNLEEGDLIKSIKVIDQNQSSQSFTPVKTTDDVVKVLGNREINKVEITVDKAPFVYDQRSRCGICSTCYNENNGSGYARQLFEYERSKPFPGGENVQMGSDTSVMRFVHRYKIVREIEKNQNSNDNKISIPISIQEPPSLVSTLATDENPQFDTRPLLGLAKSTGLSLQEILILVGQIRTNAGEIVRKCGSANTMKKVGCSLSVHQGYLNHSCRPNCEIEIRPEDLGKVRLKALREVKKDEELSISYVPTNWNGEKRRGQLKDHYKFDCRCEKCMEELGGKKK